MDDLTSKRFGNGWAFYGERETLKEKDYDALAAEAQEAADFRQERPDSVLILGATGQIGSWITLKVSALAAFSHFTACRQRNLKLSRFGAAVHRFAADYS